LLQVKLIFISVFLLLQLSQIRQADLLDIWWPFWWGIGQSQALYIHRKWRIYSYTHASSGIRTREPIVLAAQDQT